MTTSVSTALVRGLTAQGVRKFFVVLGHGTTDLGEALRKASEAKEVSVIPCRNEIEASHAATALRWSTGEGAAVVTSIGPGALQAVSASLVGASNSIGIWYIFGDETTFDEGPNMQQIPYRGQSAYLKMFSQMSETYQLHTPEAIYAALNRGAVVTNHPVRPQPFFLLLPINVQPKKIKSFNPNKFHAGKVTKLGSAHSDSIAEAAMVLKDARKIVLKIGRGAKGAGTELLKLADLLDAVIVMSPSSLGIVPSSSPRNMGVGGSKGSISGNYAIENAEVLIAVGTRAVCQSDCSRTGYPNVKQVINLNADYSDAQHYNMTTALVGDVKETVNSLIAFLEEHGIINLDTDWNAKCIEKHAEWNSFKNKILATSKIFDSLWETEVLTQPAVINEVLEWASKSQFKTFFDAGEVQANGFQIADVESEGQFISETGSSYMGFASSAVLAGGIADEKFYGVAITGDGSFMMNPQILIDAVHTKTRACIVLLDNRRMAAISSLQLSQYNIDFATQDFVEVDYVGIANSVRGVLGIYGGTSIEELRQALIQAEAHTGLSLIHIPVYFGTNECGGMGSYGRWNVGSWVDEVEELILSGSI
jgi:3D-(3,5/4)-trihydroxycyclohexane-1,2-dione acylhydrolase (decyclizing)